MSPEHQQRRRAIGRADELNQYALVEALSRSALEQFPGDVSVWLTRGRALTKLCRYDEAQHLFDSALEQGDGEVLPFIWCEKAELARRRGDFADAERCLVRADELRPNTSWILIPLAHVTWLRGDLHLAQRRFGQALFLDGKDADRDEALFNLGGVLVALGRLEEAAGCYREALELSPDYESARLRLGDVEAALQVERGLA